MYVRHFDFMQVIDLSVDQGCRRRIQIKATLDCLFYQTLGLRSPRKTRAQTDTVATDNSTRVMETLYNRPLILKVDEYNRMGVGFDEETEERSDSTVA